jgi:hypothetical protein
MHLYKPLARRTLTQVVPNFIQLRFLARNAISSPWAFGQPFDLLNLRWSRAKFTPFSS